MRDRTEITRTSSISGDAIPAPETSCGLRCCRLTEETKRSTLVKVQTLTAFHLHQTIFSLFEMSKGQGMCHRDPKSSKMYLFAYELICTLNLKIDTSYSLALRGVQGPLSGVAVLTDKGGNVGVHSEVTNGNATHHHHHNLSQASSVSSSAPSTKRFTSRRLRKISSKQVCIFPAIFCPGNFSLLPCSNFRRPISKAPHKNISFEKSKLGKLRSVSIYLSLLTAVVYSAPEPLDACAKGSSRGRVNSCQAGIEFLHGISRRDWVSHSRGSLDSPEREHPR